MWVSLIQLVEGLERQNLTSPVEDGILLAECLGT